MPPKLQNSFFNNESGFNDYEEYSISSVPFMFSPMSFIPNDVPIFSIDSIDSTVTELSDSNVLAINVQPIYYFPNFMNYNQNEMYPYANEILLENSNMIEQFSTPTLESNNSVELKSSTAKQSSRIQQPFSESQSSLANVYNSKYSTIKPRKYKCDICQKLFVRPSQLKTHMYSHTGMKPFKCTFEGCGRCFSVVSNLHRHQKIHMKPSLRKK
ncbi:53_t:CDS:2 [Gigaspora margarita]|uniref:53_t:CDS:1 n=1 Tax=Gigaspora margarita TaxID=4874 RepID=A0ABN7VKN5_GIGMA|nr:53_t:CDS:2 [Gigaspora margarita]